MALLQAPRITGPFIQMEIHDTEMMCEDCRWCSSEYFGLWCRCPRKKVLAEVRTALGTRHLAEVDLGSVRRACECMRLHGACGPEAKWFRPSLWCRLKRLLRFIFRF